MSGGGSDDNGGDGDLPPYDEPGPIVSRRGLLPADPPEDEPGRIGRVPPAAAPAASEGGDGEGDGDGDGGDDHHEILGPDDDDDDYDDGRGGKGGGAAYDLSSILDGGRAEGADPGPLVGEDPAPSPDDDDGRWQAFGSGGAFGGEAAAEAETAAGGGGEGSEGLFLADPFAGTASSGGQVPEGAVAAVIAAIDGADGAWGGISAAAPALPPPEEEEQEEERYREDDSELGEGLLGGPSDPAEHGGRDPRADRIGRYGHSEGGDESSSSSEEESDDDEEESDDDGGGGGQEFHTLEDGAGLRDQETFWGDGGGDASLDGSEPGRLVPAHVARLLRVRGGGPSSPSATPSATLSATPSTSPRKKKGSPRGSGGAVPLIKPPPTEKMKAWMEAKGMVPPSPRSGSGGASRTGHEEPSAEYKARLATKFASASSKADQTFEENFQKSPRGSPGRVEIAEGGGRTATDQGKLLQGVLCGADDIDVFPCNADEKESPLGGGAPSVSTSLLSRQPGAFEVTDLVNVGAVQGRQDYLHGGAFNSWTKDYESPKKDGGPGKGGAGMAQEAEAPEEGTAAATASNAPSSQDGDDPSSWEMVPTLDRAPSDEPKEEAINVRHVEVNGGSAMHSPVGDGGELNNIVTPRKTSVTIGKDVPTPEDTVKRTNVRAPPALKPSSVSPTALFPQNRNLIVPKKYPSPFELAVWNSPVMIHKILSFFGDPVVVCRMKAVNRDCNRVIEADEHNIMKTAVRLGGLEMHLRPSFWMWITLEKSVQRPRRLGDAPQIEEPDDCDLPALAKKGEDGRWHHTIMRDVRRSFGNMPPHKTGARIRKDSIVRALVFYGKGRLIKRGVKGGGEAPVARVASYRPPVHSKEPSMRMRSKAATDDSSIHSDQSPTDTVSDWSAISPVGSTISAGNSKWDTDVSALDESMNTSLDKNQSMQSSITIEEEDFVLSGRDLTYEVKADLQNKLGYILHCLAASNDYVGYCQGMDYVVAHLLRILQETVLYRAVKGTLPAIIKAKLCKEDASDDPASGAVSTLDIDESSLIVEETVYRTMHTMLTTYGLQHFYWPELRCLKTCCKMFERLIQLKLPVLADHFDHHDLNVGIFALGWFQTLFLYLPSMPTATVCHMWDIWLVERSFKIFYRVGTAILFLSQPILLNHELEGMMTYLNTFPDATLLNPDILIPCALQIKVTNQLLKEVEMEVTGQTASDLEGIPTATTADAGDGGGLCS